MQLTKTHKIIISAITIVILLGIYIIFDQKSKKETGSSLVDDNQTATTTDTNDDPGYTIEQVPVEGTRDIPKPIPDLNREPVFTNGVVMPEEARVIAFDKIKTLQVNLKSNPSDLPSWINLGMYRKMIGDYEGAVISWKYASRLAPTDYISLGNLGNLYAYFLKDNAQAEVYYKQAISRAPTESYLYAQLFEVYRDVFKDLDKARAILTQGLSKIPNDPNLLDLQYSLDPIK